VVCPFIAHLSHGALVPLVAVLLLVVDLLVALLVVPAVAVHPGVPLVVLVVQTAVVCPAVLLEVSPGELAAFGPCTCCWTGWGPPERFPPVGADPGLPKGPTVVCPATCELELLVQSQCFQLGRFCFLAQLDDLRC